VNGPDLHRPQRILLVNPVSLGPQHEAFDSTCLYALSHEFAECPSNIELTFVARPNHVDASLDFLSRYKAASNFAVRRLWSNRQGRLSSMVCYVQAMSVVLKALRGGRLDRIVLMVADNTITPRFLSLFGGLIQRRGIRLDVLWHNNIENMRGAPNKLRLWAKISKIDCIKIVVLENFMVELAERTFPVGKIWLWPFPIPSFIEQIQAALAAPEIPSKAYDFLVSGNHVSRAANASFFASLDRGLKACKAISSNSNLAATPVQTPTIALLGQPKSGLPDEPPLICLPRPEAYRDYLTALHQARFVLFPPDSAHRQTASGVMLDAISMGIPIVAPRAGAYTALYPDCPEGQALLYDPAVGPENAFAQAALLDSAAYQSLVESMKSLAEQRSALKFAQSFWRAGER
jgi:hypothetical protein